MINKNEKIIFSASAIGFKLKRVELTKYNISEKETIRLIFEGDIIMQSYSVSARRPFHKRVWRKIKNLSNFIKDTIDGFN